MPTKAKAHKEPKVRVITHRKSYPTLNDFEDFLSARLPEMEPKNGEHVFLLMPEYSVAAHDHPYSEDVKQFVAGVRHKLSPSQHVIISLPEKVRDGRLINSAHIISKGGHQHQPKRFFAASEHHSLAEDMGLSRAHRDSKLTERARASSEIGTTIRNKNLPFLSVKVPGFGAVGTRVCRDVSLPGDTPKLLLAPFDGFPDGHFPNAFHASLDDTLVVVNDNEEGVKIRAPKPPGTKTDVWHLPGDKSADIHLGEHRVALEEI